ncbi:MAG: tetratricopeptide repeat protein, partial [Cyanobacteria bacterium J007]
MTATQAREKRVAVERILGFAKRYGEDALNLACHAAFPLVLTPDLLYQIWANFVTQAPWTGVARVLLSPLCREVGFEMYEMDLAVRNLLLRELQEQFGKQRFEELAEFLQAYVVQRLNSEDPDVQDIAQAQNWTALAYTKPGEAARELAQVLVERLQQQDKAEVFRLTSLVETFAQPLVEAGFQPLLVYAGGVKSYVRGDLERAGELFGQLPKQGQLVSAGGIIVPIPGELLPESEVEALPTPVAIESQLNFIQAFLASPREEARNLLKANQALMTESFLLTIKQVAAIMVEEGNEESANWLRDLAAQVSENLDGTSSYFQLIMEILQVTSESQGNPSVVYPLLQQNFNKLDGNFAQIMQAWATQTLSEVEEDRAFSIAAVIGNFANLIQQFPLGSRADNLEIGIVGYEIVSTVFTPEKLPEMWATLQTNLGNAYSDRIRGERAENLETAIACYEAALQVYTPEAFPQDWAMTQNNLGAAYSDRIRGERVENLERAIACYEAALQVYTPEAFPQNWAMTQNNLGNAYLYGIRGERAENLERAIACYEAALEVYTRTAFPLQWASTQNNLGTAY